MTTIRTHCALRLGDNLAHLHFLRGLAKRYPDVHFVHAAHLCYLQQMIEVVADLPNLQLRDIRHSHHELSHNAWKNAGGFWESHELKNDYANFMLAWFDVLAQRLGLESPFERPEDLLFDYPALAQGETRFEPIDFLIVNSTPQSGQWRNYNRAQLTDLISQLSKRHKVVTTEPCGLRVPCTANTLGFSVTNIGQLSQCAKNIVMVSTGPSWPTFNVWNKDSVEFRLILIDHEVIGLSKRTEQCATVPEALRVLKVRGLL